MIEVREVLRRWRAGQGLRQTARDTGLDRTTVRRYVEAAELIDVPRDGELRDDDDVRAVAQYVTDRDDPPTSEERLALEPHRDQIANGWAARPPSS